MRENQVEDLGVEPEIFDADLVVVCLQVGGDRPRNVGFVVFRFGKADGEGVESICMPCGIGCDST